MAPPSFPGTKLKPEAEDGREIGRLESETETERMMLILMLELDADTDVVGFQSSSTIREIAFLFLRHPCSGLC